MVWIVLSRIMGIAQNYIAGILVWRIQPGSATMTEGSDHTSRVVLQPKHFLGRSLSLSWISRTRSALIYPYSSRAVPS